MKLETIRPLDKAAMAQAKAQWDAVAKPLNSLGRFEQRVVPMAGITGSAAVQAVPACVLVCCADNGVVAEGVSPLRRAAPGRPGTSRPRRRWPARRARPAPRTSRSRLSRLAPLS